MLVLLVTCGGRSGEASNPGPILTSLDNDDGDAWADLDRELACEDAAEHAFAADALQWHGMATAVVLGEVVPTRSPGPRNGLEGTYGGASSGSTGRAVQHLLGQPPVFAAASKFTGARKGMVFKLDVEGLGYYRDDTPRCMAGYVGSRTGIALVLDELILAAGGPEGALAPPPLDPASAAPPPAARRRAPARSRRVRAAGDPRAVQWADEVQLDDAEYKDWGLWAVVTANVTAWSSAGTLLQKAAADALLIQEHRVASRTACDVVEAAATYRRWRMPLQPAVVTPAGGTSAGVGIAVARHTGLARDMDMPGGAGTDHRVQVRHWSGVCPGGIHLLCVYLHYGEGLSKKNLDILQEMAFVIARLRGPWPGCPRSCSRRATRPRHAASPPGRPGGSSPAR